MLTMLKMYLAQTEEEGFQMTLTRIECLCTGVNFTEQFSSHSDSGGSPIVNTNLNKN